MFPRIQAWLNHRVLARRLEADLYGPEETRRATTCYLSPDCQGEDPGAENFRRTARTREPLFAAADRAFRNPGANRTVLFLADSGMGKTSFLINYYARHWRSRSRRKDFALRLIPLSLPDADRWIQSIGTAERPGTVLLLDGLDEDPKADDDGPGRLLELLRLTEGFRALGITCGTEFVPEEYPVSSSPGGDSGPAFRKLYLSPFTDSQIDAYLRYRFSFHKYHRRREALRVAGAAPELMSRPMLLAHVEDLAAAPRVPQSAYQAYEAMVDAWLAREKVLAGGRNAPGAFCQGVAEDIFLNRAARVMERVPAGDLARVAAKYGIALSDWDPDRRSLLIRDAAGNTRFVHRSIMEYLLARRFASGNIPEHERWTPQIQRFFEEMWIDGAVSVAGSVAAIRGQRLSARRLRGANLREADLRGVDLARADLRDADLRDADLGGANLVGANLGGADLGKAKLGGANLHGANLFSADLRGVDLADATLSETDLSSAKLNGANLRKADLSGAKLNGVDLSGADLEEANLSAANGSLANLKEANLGGADLSDVDLSLGNLTRANLREATLSGADLSLADLSEAHLSGVNLKRANLHGAVLREAKLFGADLSLVDLGGAKLFGAHLNRANLSGANLAGANLWEADLNDADLRDANLRDAEVTIGQLKNVATREGAQLSPALTESGDQTGIRRYRT